MWRKTPLSVFAANQLHNGHFETVDIIPNNAQLWSEPLLIRVYTISCSIGVRKSAMDAWQVLVSFMDRRKVLKIAPNTQISDISFLTKEFRKEFSFERNVNVAITFQRYDPGWDEMVDLDPDSRINDKDKLTAVVTPILVTPPVNSPAESYLEVSNLHVRVSTCACIAAVQAP